MMIFMLVFPEWLTKMVDFLISRFGWSYRMALICVLINLISALILLIIWVDDLFTAYIKNRKEVDDLVKEITSEDANVE